MPLDRHQSKALEEFQKAALTVFRNETQTRIRELVKRTMTAALDGDADARRLIWPYLFGGAPKAPIEIDIHNQTVIAVDWSPHWQPPAQIVNAVAHEIPPSATMGGTGGVTSVPGREALPSKTTPVVEAQTRQGP